LAACFLRDDQLAEFKAGFVQLFDCYRTDDFTIEKGQEYFAAMLSVIDRRIGHDSKIFRFRCSFHRIA
jgi:hypothetical protein